MTMLHTIAGLFALGALVGIYLVALVLQDKETPKLVAFVHGTFVGVALIMLIVYSKNNGPGPIENIVLFILAAMGSLFLIYRDLTGKPIPKWLAIGHGLLAITGFIFLIAYAF